MAFLVFLVVLNVLMFQTGAAQEDDIPSFDGEVQRREETKRSSDITSLLSKLISDMEGIKGQILSEVPEQLEQQSEEIKKLAGDFNSFKDGLQEQIVAQVNKTDASIAKLSEGLDVLKKRQDEQATNSEQHLAKIETSLAKATGQISKELADKTDPSIAKLSEDFDIVKKRQDAQTKKLDDIKEDEAKNGQHLTKIETSLAKETGQISQNLRVHDQRLQNLSNQGSRDKPVSPIYKDCSEIRWKLSRSSGAYRISLNNRLVEVYCDFDTPGGDWLVFQRRKDGSVDFYLNWVAYANGFGNVNRELWLGNEVLHQLTSNRRYKLRVELEDFENQKRFAEYSSFSVGPSSDYYRLKIGSYSGNAGDSLALHNNQQFSTYNVDRDIYAAGNCAQMYRGGWWYQGCHHSNLNGKFYRGSHSTYADGVNWSTWRAYHYSLKSEMKIALL